MKRAQERMGPESAPSDRAPRSDRGKTRLDPAVIDLINEVLAGHERPRMREILARVNGACEAASLRPPSRATIYKLMRTLPAGIYRKPDLPPAVQSALYNLSPECDIPGHQLAFYCLNYGDLAAISFAAGLPWLALHQALRMRGYRPKSRGLIESVARVRKI